MTDTSRLRIENMTRSLQEAERVIQQAKLEDKERKQRRKEIVQRVTKKFTENGVISMTVPEEEKLKQYKSVCLLLLK